MSSEFVQILDTGRSHWVCASSIGCQPGHSIGMNSRATQLKFRCPRMSHLITIMAASQLHGLANKNAVLAGRSQ